MLRKLYLIPAVRFPVNPFKIREPVSIRKQREPVKKRKHNHPFAEAVKINKYHPYEEWLKVRQKMDEADLRKKTETNAFADFFKPSDASRASYQSFPSSSTSPTYAYTTKAAPWDADGGKVGISYRFPLSDYKRIQI